MKLKRSTAAAGVVMALHLAHILLLSEAADDAATTTTVPTVANPRATTTALTTAADPHAAADATTNEFIKDSPAASLTLAPPAASPSDHCNITEVNGYLHLVCGWHEDAYYENPAVYKCPFTEQVYRMDSTISGYDDGCTYLSTNFTCPSDPGFYQACGHGRCSGARVLGNSTLLCGTYLCDTWWGYGYGGSFWEKFYQCYDGICRNTDQNMVGCVGENNTEPRTKCNNVCEEGACDDEWDCNGVQYGMRCESRYGEMEYIQPVWMCDGESYCAGGEDEEGCFNWEEGDATCNHFKTDQEIKLKEEMRCFPPNLESSVCENGEDHTNCSDPEKISMQCLSNGYPTNISIFGHCKGFKLCDDDYNNVCVEPARGCVIHKAQMCDAKEDCFDRSDEENDICDNLTKDFHCERRFYLGATKQRVNLPIPIEWAMDGQIDCLNGEDEQEKQWQKCGNGKVSRYYEPNQNQSCRDVLICGDRGTYITMEKLCDGVNTCSFENQLCAAVKDQPDIIDISDSYASEPFLQHCLSKDASDLEAQLGKCYKTEHTAGLVKTVLNVQDPVWINIPNKTIDCSFLFGENYVYAACNNLCINAACPLAPNPGDTCINKMNDRIFALADTSSPALVTLLKKTQDPGSYENQLFPCDNKNCVLYKDVCNLRDDCGDGSDEKNCTNHFKCNNTDTLLPLSSVCNGAVDCSDLSDECQSRCPPTNFNIFANIYLRSASYTIGLMATLLNFISLFRGLWELRQQKSFETFLNKSAITMICLGDLLIGIYLIAIAYFDHRFREAGDYCQERYAWLTSTKCSALGVLSTIGSQFSLFAMTLLASLEWPTWETLSRGSAAL